MNTDAFRCSWMDSQLISVLQERIEALLQHERQLCKEKDVQH